MLQFVIEHFIIARSISVRNWQRVRFWRHFQAQTARQRFRQIRVDLHVRAAHFAAEHPAQTMHERQRAAVRERYCEAQPHDGIDRHHLIDAPQKFIKTGAQKRRHVDVAISTDERCQRIGVEPVDFVEDAQTGPRIHAKIG